MGGREHLSSCSSSPRICRALESLHWCRLSASLCLHLPFLKKDFTYLLLEKGGGRERDGEKHVRDTLIGCLLHTPNWGLGTQPRHVPRLGIEPVTFWVTGQCAVH